MFKKGLVIIFGRMFPDLVIYFLHVEPRLKAQTGNRWLEVFNVCVQRLAEVHPLQ